MSAVYNSRPTYMGCPCIAFSACLISTVNVELFVQSIFSRILRSVLGAHKYDASEEQ